LKAARDRYREYFDHRDALIAADKQQHLEQLCALIVQQCLPPAMNDQSGDQLRDLALGMVALDAEDVVDQRRARTKR
jgi:hypothetical protein